jgi:hypothetical protein
MGALLLNYPHILIPLLTSPAFVPLMFAFLFLSLRPQFAEQFRQLILKVKKKIFVFALK